MTDNTLSKQILPNHLQPSYLILNGIDGTGCLRQIADTINCLSAVQESDSNIKRLTGCHSTLFDHISNLVRHTAECISAREEQLNEEILSLQAEVKLMKEKLSIAN